MGDHLGYTRPPERQRHLANVYQKMGVSSRSEASREALLKEWITIEEVTAEEEEEG